ncbi:MAG TPA: helix-turn-helix transcriptional regulator [Candidatus Nanopelagicales bacterium]|nr:helix-turn-helix transcriptional regulator [Candidatus Nanopelagicales bacterium]
MVIDIDRARAPSFGLAEELAPFRSEWHAHGRHQILYTATGVLHLEIEAGTWLLPPRKAAWLCAGTRHRVSADRPVALRTVYLAAEMLPELDHDCRVFSVEPLAREMLLFAMRWDHESDPEDRTAGPFFRAFAALTAEWIERNAHPYRLPTARSPELSRATAFILARLADPIGVEDAARAAGASTRTLARRFADELGTGFREYLHAARMLRAMDLLAEPAARVTDVALAVGFESPSAFSAAFSSFAGESPRGYRDGHAT